MRRGEVARVENVCLELDVLVSSVLFVRLTWDASEFKFKEVVMKVVVLLYCVASGNYHS